MKKPIIVTLTKPEADALAEAIGFRMAGITDDLSNRQFGALARASRKLDDARIKSQEAIT